MVTNTVSRVSENTSASINEHIELETQRRLRGLAGDSTGIQRRLEELDREWDIERCLETGSATLTLTGLILGATFKRRWLLLSLAVQGFFLQHAIQGWCPPMPVLRRIGVRTAHEIEVERHALKALRGDFADISSDEPDAAWKAANNGTKNSRKKSKD